MMREPRVKATNAPAQTPREFLAKFAAVIADRRAPMSLRTVAMLHGLSVERIRQICLKADQIEAAFLTNPVALLSVRAQNCLRASDLTTVAAIRSAAQDPKRLATIPNLGRHTIAEIQQWADSVADRGLEPAERP